MSNTDVAPTEVTCAASVFAGILHSREVPLGGPRALLVRRTLPRRSAEVTIPLCNSQTRRISGYRNSNADERAGHEAIYPILRA